MGYRTKPFHRIMERAENSLRDFLSIPDSHEALTWPRGTSSLGLGDISWNLPFMSQYLMFWRATWFFLGGERVVWYNALVYIYINIHVYYILYIHHCARAHTHSKPQCWSCVRSLPCIHRRKRTLQCPGLAQPESWNWCNGIERLCGNLQTWQWNISESKWTAYWKWWFLLISCQVWISEGTSNPQPNPKRCTSSMVAPRCSLRRSHWTC